LTFIITYAIIIIIIDIISMVMVRFNYEFWRDIASNLQHSQFIKSCYITKCCQYSAYTPCRLD